MPSNQSLRSRSLPMPGLLLLVWAVVFGCRGQALAWDAKISTHPSAPSRLFLVDKSSQTLWLLEKQSPLRIVSQVACSTGQKNGDKLVEGDLRTPEGIYFLEHRIEQDLDFELYGNLAYALNFPNPVDRIQGKTGHGIWLHGRGKQLLPRDTKGCVAVNNDILAEFQDLIEIRMTPVVIGQKAVPVQESLDEQEVSALVAEVSAWARSWQDKTGEFFDFYDPEAFARSTGHPFASFAAHKQGLFSRYPWIHVFLDDVRVVKGPGYWVTYFGQYYRTPTFTSQGVKRLYWQQKDEGFRIVGSEWLPLGLGLEAAYTASYRPEIEAVVETWRTAWERADLEGYLSFYAPDSVQDQRAGLMNIEAHKRELWARDAPEAVRLGSLHIAPHPQGFAVAFSQRYRASSGFEDLGRKTLVLEPRGEGWAIASESWQADGDFL